MNPTDAMDSLDSEDFLATEAAPARVRVLLVDDQRIIAEAVHQLLQDRLQ